MEFFLKAKNTDKILGKSENLDDVLQKIIDLAAYDKKAGTYESQRYYVDCPEQDLTINVFIGEEK